MNREDIIRMAREADLCDEEGRDDNSIIIVAHLKRFADLVAAAEREACAKVVEASPSYDWHRFACEAAAAIRARKENT